MIEQEALHYIPGVVGAYYQQGGLPISSTLKDLMLETNNWKFVDKQCTSIIINPTTLVCFEYEPPEDTEDYFIQIEFKIEYKTIVAINVLLNEEKRINAYTQSET